MNQENEQSNYEKFLSGLDPKTAKEVRSAAETETKRFPLASEGLTRNLGGGIGAGRITLAYGNQSSGKSLLFMQSVAMWQKMGLVCAWVDAEGVWDKSWAARLGINNEELILIQSKSAGRIEKKIRPYMENRIDIVVIDSISDIMPEVFIDKDGALADPENRKQLGAHAKAITGLINGMLFVNDQTAIVLISQTTTKIESTYVKQVPHGGQKVLFASSQIIKLTSSGTEGQQITGEVTLGGRIITAPVGRKVDAYVEKNKMGPQSLSTKYDIYYAGKFVGIDTFGEIVDFAELLGVVEKKGAWFKHTPTDKQYQGRTNLINALRDDNELLELTKKHINMRMTGEVIE